MLKCIFAITAVVYSFAIAEDDYACFDPKKFVAKATPVHPLCRAEVSKQKADDPATFNCSVAYIIYDRCHDHYFGIQEKVDGHTQISHKKLVKLLESFTPSSGKKKLVKLLSPCAADVVPDTEDPVAYFDCIQKECPEMKVFRADYHSSAAGMC